MKTINWKATKQEYAQITAVIKRADKMGLCGSFYSNSTCRMDLLAAHLNGSPMDFEKLLAFPDFDFTHDICGIAKHINRETGELENLFSPRCSQPAE